jgi:3',5'-nucleoside bisphosphate phosphatase
VIDLHCHSSCSDGTDTPEQLAALAAAVGLRAVALTDHDTVAGYDAFDKACADRDIRALRAAEISCLEDDRSLHVLCYFISEVPDSTLRALLATLSSDRASRNDELVARLAELGYDRVTAEEVRRSAGATTTSIGRPHVADALLRLYPREFASRQAVFDELLGRTGRAYIRKAHISVEEASAAAREDGAVTVLAHPLISLLPDVWGDDRTLDEISRRLDPVLGRLRAVGLTGVECHYSRHDELETERLVELARDHGLVPTGGSDYHGTNKPDLSLGTGTGRLSVPDELLDELEDARR